MPDTSTAVSLADWAAENPPARKCKVCIHPQRAEIDEWARTQDKPDAPTVAEWLARFGHTPLPLAKLNHHFRSRHHEQEVRQP